MIAFKNEEMVIRCLRIFMGIVFIYASYDKILNPAGFAQIIYQYQILPNSLINFSAIVLPWLELLIGICAILGLWLPGATFCMSALMTIFITALIYNLLRGLNIHCGCFSTTPTTSETASTAWYVFRDLIFAVASIALFLQIVRQQLRTDDNPVD